MRKFLISLLVASAVTPAAAMAQDSGFNRGDRSRDERGDSSSDDHPQRAQRAERAAPAERPARIEQVQDSNGVDRSVRVERAERPARAERNVEQVQPAEPIQQVRHIDRDQATQPVQHVRRVGRSDDGFTVRRPPQQEQASHEGDVQVPRDGDRGGSSGLHDRIVQNGDRTDSHHRWNGDWRNDHRYDWRNYRSRYSSLYRLGRYYDPYGWGYRRFSIGFNLWPSYYGSNSWLNDPWQYRLPPAYGPYRWVRYYDDALLVNIYDGQVVDVVYNFFW